MKIKNITKLFALILAIVMALTLFAGCKKDKTYDNETDALILSVDELDGVFNPYYSTSGPDGEVVGTTQMSMLTTNERGLVRFGGAEDCIALDYTNTIGPNQEYTDYTFVIKPNVKFSDGASLSVKDVLFGMYVVLDPVYVGSNTMYSTKIYGLNQYRTQIDSSEGGSDDQYTAEAATRAMVLCQQVWLSMAKRPSSTSQDSIAFTENDGVRTYTYDSDIIRDFEATIASTSDAELKKEYEGYLEDYKRVSRTFYEELESDYRTAETTVLKKEDGTLNFPMITDAKQYFMYMCGRFIRDSKYDVEDNEINRADLARVSSLSKEALIMEIFNEKMPGSYDSAKEYTYSKFYDVLHSWVTATTVQTYWAAEAKSAALKQNVQFDHIYGITWNQQFGTTEEDEISGEPAITPACFSQEGSNRVVTINNHTYPLATYDENKNRVDGFEVINIRIERVDPKAVWNFATTVTPMHKYSRYATYRNWNGGYTPWIAAGGNANFGVEYGDINFYTDYVKANLVPVGAGAYKVTMAPNASGDTVTYTNFYTNKMVYYERNEYFYTVFCDAQGNVLNADTKENNPKIKYLRYKVCNSQEVISELKSGAIDFASPNATKTNQDSVKENEDLDYAMVENLGYGYIGINAGKKGLESHFVRQALVRAMNTTLVLNYYTNDLASNIWYPISRTSWAYPRDDDKNANTWMYPFDNTADHSKIKSLLNDAVNDSVNTMPHYKYSFNNGVFCYNDAPLKLTFTVAGSTDDHPAYNTLKKAADILTECGLNVTVKNDANALKHLASGNLEVWAAAWSSGVDPDMFQVYHMDSKATSPYNWGYREIRANKSKYSYEWDIIERLSDKIDDARETLVQAERAEIYKECLNYILELAVEVPTYQRKNMYAFNVKKIDKSTMVSEADCTAYRGPLNQIWKLSFVTEK